MSQSVDKKSISDKQENGMRIQRGRHDKEHPYVMISRDIFRDPNLSVEAKGALGYLLTLPSTWVSHTRQLADALGIGKDKMYRILNELIENGYASKETQKISGRFASIEYFFYEVKQEFQKISTVSEKPDTEKPLPEKPDPEKQTLVNKDSSKEILKKDNNTHPTLANEEPKPAKAVRVCVAFGSHVKMTEEEHADLCRVHGAAVIAGIIEEMNDHCLASRPKGYSSYAAAIRNWLRRRVSQPKDRKFAPSSDQKKALSALESMEKHAL